MNNSKPVIFEKYVEDLIINKVFSIKDAGLTYRIINNWSEKGLINHFRVSNSKWHTFSFFQLVELNIYNELRQIGFSIKKLLKVKKIIYEHFEIKLFETKRHITLLVHPVLSTIKEEGYYLVTNRECDSLMFLSENTFIELMAGGSAIQSEIYGGRSSLVIISIKSLLENMKIETSKEKSKSSLLISSILDNESNDAELILGVGSDSKIKKIKKIEYKDFRDIKNLKELINKPNQKTTINSNIYGANKISIEKELK
jgi:DNA-binding transcriptional MerR regulator